MANTRPQKLLSIANLYHCCHDDLQYLITALGKLEDAQAASTEPQKCREQLARLKIWDDEVHASTGELDHVLRRSQDLRNHVINLLEQLLVEIEKGS
jgi:hypothetical protein